MSESRWSEIERLANEDIERCYQIAKLKFAVPFPWCLFRKPRGYDIIHEYDRCVESNKLRWPYYFGERDGR